MVDCFRNSRIVSGIGIGRAIGLWIEYLPLQLLKKHIVSVDCWQKRHSRRKRKKRHTDIQRTFHPERDKCTDNWKWLFTEETELMNSREK